MQEVGKNYPVDVLIPVYDGLEETLECINSAIAARKLNRTPHRLVVLDDATPVAALSKALKVLASKGKITLIRNPVNLGFIRNMNRAMALSPRQDVVWLNADTRVHGNWLDRLRDTAYASDDIASVTPFTNNGELMSFPVSRVSSPMPSAAEQAKLDTLASQVGSPAVELETGCGFCLYIKRAALDAVGYLDEVHLKRGYGEETDWCLRARRFGWRHMGATHVFVAHKGGISFGEEKKLRVAYNNAILRKRFPNAEARYLIFCEFDPLTSARNALQRARMSEGDLSNNNKRGYELINPEESPAPDTQSVQTPAIFCHKQTRKGSTLSLTIAEASPALIIEYLLPAEENLLVGDLDTANLMGPRFQYIYEGNGSHDELPSAVTALICANHKKDEYYEHQINKLTAIPRKILIADDLRDEVILQLWIDFAQVLKTACEAIQILLIDKGPAIVPLLATGLVYELSLIPGLDIKACAILAGVETEARLEINLLADEFRTGRETLPNGDIDWHAINYQSKIKLLPSDFIKILKMKYSQKV
jgi:GT2 family glycosyltransferase